MAKLYLFSLLGVFFLPSTSALCKEGLPCVIPEKGFYTDNADWIDLECKKWIDNGPFKFEIEDGTGKTKLMFDGSAANPIPAEFIGIVAKNPKNNGILYNVKGSKAGTLPIYCTINGQRSPPMQLNYVSKLTLKTSSTKLNPSAVLQCDFQMVPKNNYHFSVNYYCDDRYLGSIREGKGYFGPVQAEYFPNNVPGIDFTAKYNPKFEVTLKQTGKFPKSNYYCTLTNTYIAGNVYKSASVEIDTSGSSANSSSGSILSLFSTLVSLLFVTLFFN